MCTVEGRSTPLIMAQVSVKATLHSQHYATHPGIELKRLLKGSWSRWAAPVIYPVPKSLSGSQTFLNFVLTSMDVVLNFRAHEGGWDSGCYFQQRRRNGENRKWKRSTLAILRSFLKLTTWNLHIYFIGWNFVMWLFLEAGNCNL